jgi:ubiquinone/menaquinone biosynthesis C-methylase UbiE
MLIDTDPWMRWLLRDRYGDDVQAQAAVQARVAGYADRLLSFFDVHENMTLVDLGTGGGLVAFRAIERFGAGLRVILTDISTPLLERAARVAYEIGLAPQCRFAAAAADDLAPLVEGLADMVTARSVLAYVEDRPRAFAEIYRVLKPGGRFSIAEPVFRDEALAVMAMQQVLDQRGDSKGEPLLPLLHRWKAAQFPDAVPANYTERDLLHFAQSAGFVDLHMECHINVTVAPPVSWARFINTAPHPLAPPLRVIMQERFSAGERAVFEELVRPGVEAGGAFATERMVFLTGVKASK